MTVVAAVAVIQWADALVAATPIDDRTWLEHLITRLRRAACVTRVVVVCHPGCVALVAPLVPPGVTIETAADPWTWGAAADADLVARCHVTQLFADPVHIDRLAATARAPQAHRIHAGLPNGDGVDLTGGAYVDLLTPAGCAAAATGAPWAQGAVLPVPADPEPPELWLRSAADAGWGVTLQRALLAHGMSGDLTAVDAVLTADRLRRFDFWPDGVGRGPARVLTVRCQPAPLFARLMRHLARLPAALIDVVCPAALADDTAAVPGVASVLPFDGPSFDLDRVDGAWLGAVRARGYDLCLVPRRTADGHGFANVTALGAASGARVAAWIDLRGHTGLLAGVARGWEPWVTEAPPWHQVTPLRARAARAWRGGVLAPEETAEAPEDAEAVARAAAADIVARLDEYVACQALVDNPDAGLELAPLLLHQTPAVIAAHAAVARLRAAGRPVAPRVGAVVERVLEHGVHLLCDVVPGAADARSDVVRQAAEALGALAARVEAAGDRSDDEAGALELCDQLAHTLAHAAAGGDGRGAQTGRA